MMLREIFLTLGLCLATTGLSVAQDELTLENTTPKPGAILPRDEIKIQIDSPMIRFSQTKASMLFNTRSKNLVRIDHKKKEYLELSKEQLESMAGTVNALSGAFQKQMENMTPEQKEKVMARFSKGPLALMAQGKKSYTYEEVKKDVPCGEKWKCSLIESKSDGVKISEIYLADFSSMGLEAKSIEALKVLGQFFQEITEKIGAQGPQFKFDKFEGLPVEVIIFDETGINVKRTTKIVKSKKFIPDASTFNTPKGYAKGKMPIF